jgi:hypothetical protein
VRKPKSELIRRDLRISIKVRIISTNPKKFEEEL